MSNVKISTQGVTHLIKTLESFGPRVHKRVLNNAGKRASKIVLDQIKNLTPKATKKNDEYAMSPHLRDTHTMVQRTYRGQLTVFVIGPRAGVSPHKFFVNDGTEIRYTNRRTTYRTVSTKLVRRKGGGYRTKVIRKKSGSERKDPTKREFYRGKMPAFKFMEKGFRATRQAALREMEATIRRGIARENRRRFGV